MGLILTDEFFWKNAIPRSLYIKLFTLCVELTPLTLWFAAVTYEISSPQIN